MHVQACGRHQILALSRCLRVERPSKPKVGHAYIVGKLSDRGVFSHPERSSQKGNRARYGRTAVELELGLAVERGPGTRLGAAGGGVSCIMAKMFGMRREAGGGCIGQSSALDEIHRSPIWSRRSVDAEIWLWTGIGIGRLGTGCVE